MPGTCLFGKSPQKIPGGGVGEGLHKWRLGKDAGFDLLLTLGGAIALGYIPGGPGSTFWIIVLLLSAIIFHSLFCVPTSMHEWINKRKTNAYPFAIFLICIGIFIIATFKNDSK